MKIGSNFYIYRKNKFTFTKERIVFVLTAPITIAYLFLLAGALFSDFSFAALQDFCITKLPFAILAIAVNILSFIIRFFDLKKNLQFIITKKHLIILDKKAQFVPWCMVKSLKKTLSKGKVLIVINFNNSIVTKQNLHILDCFSHEQIIFEEPTSKCFSKCLSSYIDSSKNSPYPSNDIESKNFNKIGLILILSLLIVMTTVSLYAIVAILLTIFVR